MSRCTLLLMLLGCLGERPIVDETGYIVDENNELTEVDGTETPPTDDGRAGDPSLIFYTSTDPLDGVIREVSIIGLPGSLTQDTAVQAQVGIDGALVDAVVAGLGFTVVVDAAAGDSVQLTAESGAVIALITIEESAVAGAGAEPPEADPGAFEDVAVENDQDGDGMPDIEGGVVSVGPGVISWLQPPYLSWNQDNGASVRVDVGDNLATLPAEVGDEICFAGLSDMGLGLSSCITL